MEELLLIALIILTIALTISLFAISIWFDNFKKRPKITITDRILARVFKLDNGITYVERIDK